MLTQCDCGHVFPVPADDTGSRVTCDQCGTATDIKGSIYDFDFYNVFGITPDAKFDKIHDAYRRLALKWHPDRGGTHEMMVLVNIVYDVLSDPVSRKHYDDLRAATTAEKSHAAGEDMRRAASKAKDYPREWHAFEESMDKLKEDWRKAKYSHKKDDWLPTVEDSISGQVFLWGGAVIVVILGFMTGMRGGYLALGMMGGAIGVWLHKQIKENVVK
jgi:curved DNA-binding protein CbpA